jgi:putative membrane protein
MNLLMQLSGDNLQLAAFLDTLTLLLKTIGLRPYVFLFLAASVLFAQRLIGRKRAGSFFVIAWLTAFVSEFSSTRTGIPFGWYQYTGSTVGQELYLSNVPLMDPLSLTMLLYGSYCLALSFLLPSVRERFRKDASPRERRLLTLTLDRSARTGWPALLLTALLFVFIDMVIDPVALRGDRWFLGKIYYYSTPGLHFGVPVANYVGWAVVGLVALWVYFRLDRRLPEPERRRERSVTSDILMGCGLYYSILLFNLTITVWIDEPLIAMTGVLIYLPLTVLLLLRLLGKLPAPATWRSRDDRILEWAPAPRGRSAREAPNLWEPVGALRHEFQRPKRSSGFEAGTHRLIGLSPRVGPPSGATDWSSPQ